LSHHCIINIKDMSNYVFVWYTRKGEKREYRTPALTKQEAEARYWDAQMRNKQRKDYLQAYKIVNKKRVKI
jgi:hypothetical protein